MKNEPNNDIALLRQELELAVTFLEDGAVLTARDIIKHAIVQLNKLQEGDSFQKRTPYPKPVKHSSKKYHERKWTKVARLEHSLRMKAAWRKRKKQR